MIDGSIAGFKLATYAPRCAVSQRRRSVSGQASPEEVDVDRGSPLRPPGRKRQSARPLPKGVRCHWPERLPILQNHPVEVLGR